MDHVGFALMAVKNVIFLVITICASIALRLTWIINPSIMGGDESTYLVVASRLLHGELPYTSTFDNKPPLAEIPQALAILTLGNSLTSVRLGCAIFLGVAAYFLSTAAFSNRNTWLRLPIALAIISLYTLTDQGPAWQAELNSILFFSLALWLFVKKCPPYLVGLVAGIIPLTRTNWLLVTMAFALVLAIWPRPSSWVRVAKISAGVLTPITAIAVVYWISGHIDRLFIGAFLLPMMRQESAPLALPHSWLKYSLLSLILITASLIINLRARRIEKIPLDILVISSILGLTAIAAYQSPDFDHHSLQIVVFLPIAAGMLANTILTLRSNPNPGKWKRLVTSALVASLILFSGYFTMQLTNNEIEQWDVWAATAQISEVRVNTLRAIPGIESASLWVVGGPDLLYRLDKAPIHPLATEACLQANPAIRSVYYGADPGDVASFRDFLERKPDVVVVEWLGCTSDADQEMLFNFLAESYRPIGEEGLRMWVRTKP